MKPNILSQTEWNILLKKNITYTIWNNLDGLKKLAFLRNIVDLSQFKILSDRLSPQYPEDIYLYNIKELRILPTDLLARLKRTTYLSNEIGGTINYDNNNIREFYKFNGDINKVVLNLRTDTQTLFHTHPKDERVYDPPSILDIVSYLANIIHHIGNIVLDVGNQIEHPLDDPLVIQNSMVFTPKSVYVYYISYDLIKLIVIKLTKLYQSGNYIEKIGSFIQEMEIAYVNYLFPYNSWYNTSQEVERYITELNKIGIIMKRYDYDQSVQSYILN